MVEMYTSDPVFDEKLILDTMRLWFKNRIDIGSKYFEEDAVVWLLFAYVCEGDNERIKDAQLI
jgi:hypothetical protein